MATYTAYRYHEVEMVDGRFEKSKAPTSSCRCERVFLAMGFVGPEPHALFEQLGIELNQRDAVAHDDNWRTNVDNVFVCGDR